MGARVRWLAMVIDKGDRKTPGIKSRKDPDKNPFTAPDGFWVNCPSCGGIFQQEQVQELHQTCPDCRYHFRLRARDRLSLHLDNGEWKTFDQDLPTKDRLQFVDKKAYSERMRSTQKKAGTHEAFISAEGKIEGRVVQVGAFDFPYMGGSMGTVVGEKVARLFERAAKKKQAAIIFHASGGARMQEGILSLMQMAKTVAALDKLKKTRAPYISVLTDPTTGGVAASFALLGDINVAEPNALIGFAGPRVIAQTINEKLPENFQRSEFLLDHGVIDEIVDRSKMKSYLSRALSFYFDS